MQQVKIFKSVENELSSLEAEINEWIASTGAKVLNITGNISPQSLSSGGLGDTFSASDVLLFILYENAN